MRTGVKRTAERECICNGAGRKGARRCHQHVIPFTVILMCHPLTLSHCNIAHHSIDHSWTQYSVMTPTCFLFDRFTSNQPQRLFFRFFISHILNKSAIPVQFKVHLPFIWDPLQLYPRSYNSNTKLTPSYSIPVAPQFGFPTHFPS